MRTKTILVIGLVVILGGAFLWGNKFFAEKVLPQPQDEKPIEENPIKTITYTNATSDLIVVDLPFPGAVTGKEFSVLGKARGQWFFEASFPIKLQDNNGKVIAQGIAQAQGEWMTTNFVPFKADMQVPQTFIGEATLILKKDNPSGLPEHDASISFPITVEY